MNPALIGAVARLLDVRLGGSFVSRVWLPGRWALGLGLQGGLTLGFCWEPASLAIGLSDWTWPRGNPPDVLKEHLRSARIEAVEGLPGEPVLLLRLRGEKARALVWEGIGRSSNCLLLGEEERILWSGRVLGGPYRHGRTGTPWTRPEPRTAALKHPGGGDPERYLLEEGPESLRAGLLARGRRACMAALQSREKALARRRDAILGDRAEAEAWVGLESLGQALLASGDLHKRGDSARRVADYTRDPPAETDLVLDPALSVLENAQRLFRKAKKGHARLQRTQEILASIDVEIGRIPEEKLQIEMCQDLDFFYPAPRRGKSGEAEKAVKAKLPPGVSRLELPKGFTGFAGKNARGNDAVSFRLGRGEDFWFHAEDYAGCHVVVKNPDRRESLPPDVERAAALHAAARSDAPPGNLVAVTLARCKNLRRVPGVPGRVWVSKPRTIRVDLPPRR